MDLNFFISKWENNYLYMQHTLWTRLMRRQNLCVHVQIIPQGMMHLLLMWVWRRTLLFHVSCTRLAMNFGLLAGVGKTILKPNTTSQCYPKWSLKASHLTISSCLTLAQSSIKVKNWTSRSSSTFQSRWPSHWLFHSFGLYNIFGFSAGFQYGRIWKRVGYLEILGCSCADLFWSFFLL